MRSRSFPLIFRFVFVAFFLFLIGDAFHRWDGFSYYASFSEFLPSVALASVLWGFVALLAAIICWLFFEAVSRGLWVLGFRVDFEQMLFFVTLFIVAGSLTWSAKKYFWPDVQTTILLKSVVLVFVILISSAVSLHFRDRAEIWMRAVLERIVPLMWLFGIFVVLSVPLVAYHVWTGDDSEVVHAARSGGTSASPDTPNFILVTFDALAARNMSLYGYENETTPFISKWAKNATVFTAVESSSNFTTPAVASLMTGKRLWTHQTYHIEGSRPVRGDTESLPYLLKKNGYYNIALVVNPYASVSTLGMKGSFDIAPPASEFGSSDSLFGWKFGVIDRLLYNVFGEKIKLHNWILNNEFIFSKVLNILSRNITETPVAPDRAFNRFLQIFDKGIDKPFFAWVHVFPPHDPYLSPDAFKSAVISSELRSYRGQEKLIEESYKYLFQFKTYPAEMQPAVTLMSKYYDEFVRYIDDRFGYLIAELERRDVDNTVILLSADHGESFKHGYFTHGGPFLYEQVTHIPLVIKAPGQTAGKVVNARAAQIDISATILDLADISVPEWMEGRSLKPLMGGEDLPARPVFSMNMQDNQSMGHEITRGSIAVWDGDYKLVHYLGKDESMLFNISSDSGEMNDLILKELETGLRLLTLIRDNLKDANEAISLGQD